MAVLPINDLKNVFATGDTPTGSDFANLIDTTSALPSATNLGSTYTTGLTLVQGSTAIPVTIDGVTYYLPVYTTASVTPDQAAYTSTVRQTYPNAVLAETFGTRCATFIESLCGYPPGDVITAACICSDDKNASIFPDNTFGQYPTSLQQFSGPFFAGGIGGYPFPGIVGLFAWMSHVTETGALFIYVHPHIGITKSGQVGYMKRRGQAGNLSQTCGAVNAAQGRIVGTLSAVALTAASPTLGGTYGQRMKIATDAIRDAAGSVIETILPISYNAFFQGENTVDVFVHVGTFVNVDDGYGAYVDTTSFKKYNAVTQTFTTLTSAFTATFA